MVQMKLKCTIGKNHCEICIAWTEEDRSIAFRQVDQQLALRYQLKSPSPDYAAQMDSITDQLYSILKARQTSFVTYYDPTMKRKSQACLFAIRELINRHHSQYHAEFHFAFYCQIFNNIAETMQLYLEDNRYQNRVRMQKKRDVRTDVYDPVDIGSEFEDLVLQMSDIARNLDCLTEVQRRRLVLHFFMGYTVSEIAREENAKYQAVQDSIRLALKKLKDKYGQL